MPTDIGIGSTIGNYTIKSLLGRGGMSVVYVAEDAKLGRNVALKVMADELAENEAFRTRFDREAKLAAALEDPNIVPVYDAGEVDGVLYLAMRIIRGTNLRTVIVEGGPVGTDRALSILRQIGSALDAAHDAGLVHRDVKPANILLTVRGDEHAYLSDFGLTKHISSKTGLTKTGQFMGTIDYVAPEQIRGAYVDGRTDQYSLGCVLYECLTGEVPFVRERDLTVLVAHLEEDPRRVTDQRPDLPARIDSVVARALAKNKEERFETCTAFVLAAQEALARTPAAANTAPATAPVAPTIVVPAPGGDEDLEPHPSFPPETEGLEPHPSLPPETEGIEPHPSLPPETEGIEPHPSLPPETEGIEPHPSLPPETEGIEPHPSLPPETEGIEPHPSLPPETEGIEPLDPQPHLATSLPLAEPIDGGASMRVAPQASVVGESRPQTIDSEAALRASRGRRTALIAAVALIAVSIVTVAAVALSGGRDEPAQAAAGSQEQTTATTSSPAPSPPTTVVAPLPVEAPVNVRATDVSTARVALIWAAAPDGDDPAQFLVFRNGTRIGATTGTSFSDSGVVPNTSYTYRIVAVGEDGSRARSLLVKVDVPAQTISTPPPSTGGGAPPGGGTTECQNEFRNVCLD